MQISILTVSKETKPTAKGSYQQLEVNFKNLTFNKVESKKIMSFGANAPAFNALVNAKTGDVFDITVVKNDKGYNDWVACTQAAPGTVTEASNNAVVGKSSVQVKSTYETPEERAIKQSYIIRQSSLSAAINTLTVGSKSVSPDDVLKLAERYTAWVFQKPAEVAQQDVFSLPNDMEVE